MTIVRPFQGEPIQTEPDDRLVGFVGSGSRAAWCYVLLIEEMENVAMEESFAYVVDRGQKVLGVLRSGLGIDENLRVGSYSPGVAYARKGYAPSSARRSFTYILSVIGRVEGGSIRENRFVLTPGSPVYLCNRNPFSGIEGNFISAARHWEKPWRILFDPNGIPMHIGVFGSTGSGKSFLTRHVIIPVARAAGYSVLVFDWHGSDYAPHALDRLSMSEVQVSGALAAAYLAGKARFSSKIRAQLCDLMERTEAWRSMSLEDFKRWAETELAAALGEKEWAKLRHAFSTGMSKVSEQDWSRVRGKLSPSDIIDRAARSGLLVIDMSGFGDEEKLMAFSSIAEEVKGRIEAGMDVNLCMIIDEAPQYCPYKASGPQETTKDLIRDMAAIGRKRRLSLVLISQGMAGEIGIDPAVRRNINTHFIGRIMPQDRREAEDMLGAHHISYENLLRLETGQFYFHGRMNPFPTPLLISFDIK